MLAYMPAVTEYERVSKVERINNGTLRASRRDIVYLGMSFCLWKTWLMVCICVFEVDTVCLGCLRSFDYSGMYQGRIFLRSFPI
jgi:hypothetical protein